MGTSNFYLDNGSTSFEELLRQAEGGVLIADVSGVHSGANPISGEFSVGATGLRIEGGGLGEPLREMTIASTLPQMLAGITGRRRRPAVLLQRRHPVGADRRDDPRGRLAPVRRRDTCAPDQDGQSR